MQETYDPNQKTLRQMLHQAETEEALRLAMDADVREGEEVVRRVPLEDPSVRAINRHERRKAEALARRERRHGGR